MQHRDGPDDLSPGVAGQSARHEYERRRQPRRDRAASRGRLAHLSASLTAEPQSTKAWARGAKGEEIVGARLDRLRERGIGILHDRRIPGRGNIDHLAVTSGGVWVINTKRYKGRPELKVQGGLFRPRTERLTVGGRDRDRLVDGVLTQVEHVRRTLGEIPVTGRAVLRQRRMTTVRRRFHHTRHTGAPAASTDQDDRQVRDRTRGRGRDGAATRPLLQAGLARDRRVE